MAVAFSQISSTYTLALDDDVEFDENFVEELFRTNFYYSICFSEMYCKRNFLYAKTYCVGYYSAFKYIFNEKYESLPKIDSVSIKAYEENGK